jgi:hypothetical protein
MSALLNIVSSLAYGTAFAGVLFLIPAIQELKNNSKPHNGKTSRICSGETLQSEVS